MKNKSNPFPAVTVFFILALFLSCADGTDKPVIDQEDYHVSRHRPEWLDDMPLVVSGNWDAQLATQRRWGRMAVDYKEGYRKRLSEETIIRMKETGVTLAITHYFKGYGLEGEGDNMEDTRRFAELARKHGLRVGVYIGNTVSPEQLLLEKPEAEEWLTPDYLGAPVTWGVQTFRSYPYIGHPGYQDYIKRVLKKAILEAKVDLIHFDNSLQYGKPEIFHHPLAIEHFRDFLRNKYTPDQLEDRFDFRDPKYVIPPMHPETVMATPQPIQDPLFQEWTDFRCWKVSKYLRDMHQYIKKLNPEVVVEANNQGDNGDNFFWRRGRDLARMLPHTEASWAEVERDPGVMENGALPTRIRSLKKARIFDNKLFYHVGHMKLKMAEAMAYNQNCIGYVGAFLSAYYRPEETNRYVRYFHDHFPYYKHTRNIAPVAVLRTFPTMAYSSHDTRYSTYLYEQTLIQTRVPFNIIFDQHLEEDLSQYKVLVIANQESMSDEQVELVKAFVKKGGGLVITENTSLYNEWRRRRHRLGLRELFEEDLPYPPGTKISQHPWAIDSKFYRHSSLVKELESFTEDHSNLVRGRYGKGRVVYIPHVEPGLPKPSNSPPTGEYWKLPANYMELEEAVRWAAGEPLPIEVKAPLHVTMELVMQEETNRMMVHLVNYDYQNHPMVKNISVRLELPGGKKVKDITMFSPDIEVKGGALPWKEDQNRITFTVPSLHVYDMVAIEFN